MLGSRLTKHTITVSRVSRNDTIIATRTEIYTNIPALIMPIASDAFQQSSASIGQAFRIHTDAEYNIIPTDKIVDSDGRVFIVRGVKRFDVFERMNHTNCFCEYLGEIEDVEEES